ncbi:alpha/beta fold hydrolase [Aggregatilinea lenta]|uniref:alpha/beta fold hydrolase n=1 Tax=Aggregatilinea lenta TaxID=913108 RepID=UPI000E5A3BFA|nr:alpha/beta fold hydrolase [Aggregatilinea lenta]
MTDPVTIHDGLAIYAVGDGAPVLLMPYPHSFTRVPAAEGTLSSILQTMGRRVISFDPPGAYRSTRPARNDLPEMLACAQEALDLSGVSDPVDVVGHSMSALCSLVLALDRPDRVRRLALVGGLSGTPALRRYKAIPYSWGLGDPRFWRMATLGLRMRRGRATLADHNRLQYLIALASYRDPSQIPPLPTGADAEHKPAPVRSRWARTSRRLDFRTRLDEVRAPTWIAVGRYDPQTPVGCSVELAKGIPDAALVIFERSGHAPFVEERERFSAALSAFWERPGD